MNILSKRCIKTRLSILMAAVVMSAPAYSVQLYVADLATAYDIDEITGNTNDCEDFAAPCLTISHAVQQADSLDEIVLSAQTYEVENVLITKDITFTGEGINNTLIRTPEAVSARHFTIDLDQDIVTANITAHVTFEGMRFKNGDALSENGGSIFVNIGSLHLKNTKFKSNQAENGGAVYCAFGESSTCYELIINNSKFVENTATVDGGGVYAHVTTVHEFTVTLSEFKRNVAGADGGGLLDRSQVTAIARSTFSDNEAGRGGGMHTVATESTVQRSTYDNNTASSGGGAVSSEASRFYADNTTVSENVSDNWGGAFMLVGMFDMHFDNLTFYGNSAPFGGTFDSDVDIPLYNSIVLDSRLSDACSFGTSIDTGVSFTIISIDDASCGAGGVITNIGSVTSFNTALVNNGGPTKTHAINQLSNAKDAATFGCLNVYGGLLEKDQRNEVRDINCDLGAYEYQPFFIPPFDGGNL